MGAGSVPDCDNTTASGERERLRLKKGSREETEVSLLFGL